MSALQRIYQSIWGMVKRIFLSGLTDESIALSVTVGILAGVFPIPFVSSVPCAIMGYLVGAHTATAQIVNVLLSPVQIICLFPFLYLGKWISSFFLADDEMVVNVLDLTGGELVQQLSESPLETFSIFADSFLFATVAWLLFSLLLFQPIFWAVLPLTKRIVQRMRRE